MTLYPQGYADTLQPDCSFWQQCADGYYLIIPIALLLLGVLYILVDRMIFALAASRFDNALMQRMKDYIHENETESAINLCRKNNSAASRVVDKGVRMLGHPLGQITQAMTIAVDIEVCRLKAGGLRWLNFAALGAPLLGIAGAAAGTLHAVCDQLPQLQLFTPLATLLWGALAGVVAWGAAQYIKALINRARITLLETANRFVDILNEPAA